MEFRKDAQRNRNAGTQLKADAKTSEALGMEYPTTPEKSGQKKKKKKQTSPVPVPGHSPPVKHFEDLMIKITSVPWGS